MGKIRVKTLGDETLEAKEAEKAQKRADTKASKNGDETSAAPVAEKPTKNKNIPSKKHQSPTYQKALTLVEKGKNYHLKEAVELLPKLTVATFDETVELHINTNATGVSGNMTLPHGTGKQTRVVIATDEIIAEIEKGVINFDILIAEPQMMPKLAKVARILGPRGLMPNPKNGTVTPKPEEVAKKFEGGQINFKTEAKFPLLHLTVGKVSFGPEKLQENIKTALQAVQMKNVKNVTLKSTMSPGMRLDTASL